MKSEHSRTAQAKAHMLPPRTAAVMTKIIKTLINRRARLLSWNTICAPPPSKDSTVARLGCFTSVQDTDESRLTDVEKKKKSKSGGGLHLPDLLTLG